MTEINTIINLIGGNHTLGNTHLIKTILSKCDTIKFTLTTVSVITIMSDYCSFWQNKIISFSTTVVCTKSGNTGIINITSGYTAYTIEYTCNINKVLIRINVSCNITCYSGLICTRIKHTGSVCTFHMICLNIIFRNT